MIKDAMVEVHNGGHSVLESFDLTITAHTHVGAQMCIIYCPQDVTWHGLLIMYNI